MPVPPKSTRGTATPASTAPPRQDIVRCVEAYLARLRAERRGVPAHQHRPDRPCVALVRKEAGYVHPTSSRTRKAVRDLLERAVRELGLEVRYARPDGPITFAQLRKEARERRRRELEADHGASVDPGVGRKVSSQLGNLGWALNWAAGGRASADAEAARPILSAALERAEAATGSDSRRMRAEIRRSLDVLEAMEGAGDLPEGFGEALTLACRRQGLSLSCLAREVGVTPNRLRSWASGRANPDVFAMDRIAVVERRLGLDAGELSGRVRRRRASHGWVPATSWPEDVRGNQALKAKLKPHLPPDLLEMTEGERAAAFAAARKRVPASPRTVSALLLRDTYYLRDFGEGCEAQFRDLVDFRNSPVARLDTERGEPWSEGSVRARRQQVAAVLGFLVHRRDPPVDRRDLSLALFAFPKVLHDWQTFKVKRVEGATGRAYLSCNDLAAWQFFAALTEPSSGWLSQSPRLAATLRTVPGLVGEDEVAAAVADWSGTCGRAHEVYRKFARASAGRVEVGRDGQEIVRPVLEMGDPLVALRRLGSSLRTEWLDAEPGTAHRALAVRNVVLNGLMSQCAFRSDTLRKLDWLPDGGGHLRREGDGWWSKVPRQLFKNGSKGWFRLPDGGFRDYARRLADVHGLYDALEEYLLEGRPMLLREPADPALLVSQGTGTRFEEIYVVVANITARHLGPRCPDGMPGMRAGFGPHGYRHILATGVLKRTRSFTLAADAIHDTEPVCRRHYAKWVPEQWAEILAGIIGEGLGDDAADRERTIDTWEGPSPSARAWSGRSPSRRGSGAAPDAVRRGPGRPFHGR